jgi:hypothetical protein
MIIESLRSVLSYAIDYLDIIEFTSQSDPDIAAILQLIDAYDALAPKEWAEGYDFYAIDIDGEGGWYTNEPAFDFDAGYWISKGCRHVHS